MAKNKKWCHRQIPARVSSVAIWLLIVVISSYTSYKLGQLAAVEHNPPATKLLAASRARVQKKIDKNSQIDPVYLRNDVFALISTRTAKSILQKRRQLIQFIWGDTRLPSHLPSQIDNNFFDARYADLYNNCLQQIEKIVVDMDFGLKSTIYHFIPTHQNGKLVIVHQGHEGDFVKRIGLIAKLLQLRYSVAGFCMPLFGLNNKPTIFHPRFGYIKLERHQEMQFIPCQKGHNLKYFLEPVVVFLNYAVRLYRQQINMLGISGGGWTTTLVAAIDPRIRMSFPIAGSYPIYLRSNTTSDWGDYEQTVVEVYQLCNYLELYMLGAYGKQRRQLQIINKYDRCCFAGIKWQTYYPLLRKFSATIEDLDWDLFMDDSHMEHKISTVAQEKILFVLQTGN